MFGGIHPVKPYGPGIFFVGKFFHTIFACYSSVEFFYSFLSKLFDKLCVFRICPFNLEYLIFGIYLLIVFYYKPFHFCKAGRSVLTLISQHFLTCHRLRASPLTLPYTVSGMPLLMESDILLSHSFTGCLIQG